tara:strand:+ start:8665 stop:9252 length:588 start_codon:yes stop_codon:yes gene_type:complete
MSLLMPFELLTIGGWKAGDQMREEDMVACVHPQRGFEYKTIRQYLVYNSNFNFTIFTDKISKVTVAICEGGGTPLSSFDVFQPLGPPAPSRFLQACREVVTEEYDPDPVKEFRGGVAEVEAMQIQAISEGIEAFVSHEEAGVSIQTSEALFVASGMTHGSQSKAVAVSCYEECPTHLVVRLAALETCYRTRCLVV